jgi:hypothetical protein
MSNALWVRDREVNIQWQWRGKDMKMGVTLEGAVVRITENVMNNERGSDDVY